MKKQKKTPDLDSFNIDQLMSDMEEFRTILSKVPDGKEWSMPELDNIEEVRAKALALAREIEWTFDGIRGTKS